jgi:hypothetical protein
MAHWMNAYGEENTAALCIHELQDAHDALAERVAKLEAGAAPVEHVELRDLQEANAAMHEELAALRKLEEAVLLLGDVTVWRERTEHRGDLVYCSASDCAVITNALSALDKARIP